MLEPLARLGYACKSLIYAIVGSLALAAALRRGGGITDTSGALRVILEQSYGRALLVVLAVGLCGYAVWRVLDAIRDPDDHGTGVKGIVTRIGNAVRAVIYGGLGIEAFRLIGGLRGSNGRDAQVWTSRAMDVPFGALIVGLLGAVVSVYGVSEIVASFKGGYSRTLDVSPIPARLRRTADVISRFGIGARGVIITVLGVFLVRAAFAQDPSQAHGTRGSMRELATVADGPWLLVFIGAGLLAYAVDQAVHARCRRIAPVT
ncbi:MAG: DUF1206 domain-containing protein [Vicinamibacterales bacterium]